MESTTPKQFIELKGKPILMHSILAFFRFDEAINITVVLPEHQISVWKQLCEQHNFQIEHEVIKGGEERFHSVKNGLNVISEKGIVAIHDGVRPLVSKDTLTRCFEEAEKSGNAIPIVDILETIREVQQENSHAVSRDNYKLVQTPQCFDVELIKSAFKQEYQSNFTDDASVAEAFGIMINLVEGNRENIKITTPSDLLLAEALLVDK
ncbi:MAG: 2-C-methyl-D-erythritol 4-phosphate cytidylyltransferase [Flavobacteriales bacterium]|nr:2-C-methyl-D-erythritol 4-phosphate cytidylyltransferase [Flavobacteriales bacterium]